MQTIPHDLISDKCPEGVLVYINKDHFLLIKSQRNGVPIETVIGAVLIADQPVKPGTTTDTVTFPLRRDPNTYLYITGNEFPDPRALAIWDMIFDNLNKYLALKGYRG
jgi:hypothetical protein